MSRLSWSGLHRTRYARLTNMFRPNGDFMRTAPNATRAGDTTFVYGDVTYTFGAR